MVRFKNRYALVHIKGNKNQNFTVSPVELFDYFKTNVLKYYGDFGMASVGNLSVKYCDPDSKLLILRVSHGPHRFLTSILPLLTVAGKESVVYRILYIGATIRQCKKHIIKHQHQFIGKTLGAINTHEDKEEFLKNLENKLQM
ncbi:unnamed protein product [Diamesa serratosioi]